jgi:hypothetical protein
MSAIDIAAWALTILVAAGCVWAVLAGRPDLALGSLFAAASFSGITAPIGSVGVRLEQPAVIAIAVVLAVRRPTAVLAVIRAARWPMALAAIYLAANIASAVLVSPDRTQSLKICLWLAISLLAACVAAVLICDVRDGERDRRLIRWGVGAACVSALIAGVQVAAELWLGSDWGLIRGDAPIGKAAGLAWEPNLLAIGLAAILMFLLDSTTRRWFTRRTRFGAIVLISAGIGLALSRGGIVALGVGVGALVLIGVIAPRGTGLKKRSFALMGPASLAFAIAIGVYAGLVWLGANGVGVRTGEIVTTPSVPESSLIAVAPSARPSGPRATSAPGGTSTPVATPTPAPRASVEPVLRFNGASDTVGLRWRNLQTAILDGLTSPIIGLGPDTFGKRYLEPSCGCPAHIPNQLSATFYESGVVGLLSLGLLLGLVTVRAWQLRLTAYVASLVVLVVGYQFTDALRFASNWVLIGATIGLIVVKAGSVAGPFSRARPDTPSQLPRRTPPT